MIKFKNYCNQLPSLFRTYADFESNLEDVEIWEGNYSIIEIWEGNHHKHIDCAFAYKVVCTDARFSKRIKIFRGNNAAYEFVRAILEEFEWCKKVIKKYFNKKGRLKRKSINFK